MSSFYLEAQFDFYISVPDLFVHDGTADYVRAQASLLESQSHRVCLVAQRTYQAELHATCHPEEITIEQARTSRLIFHYGIHDEYALSLIKMPFREKILYFHNITPPHLVSSPKVAEVLQRSWVQFLDILPYFSKRIANSPFTIQQAQARSMPFREPRGRPAPWCWLPPRITSISKDSKIKREEGKNPLQICMIGRLAGFKNTNAALELFREIHKLNKCYSLYIVGRPAEVDMHEQEESLLEAIESTPNVYYQENVSNQIRNSIVASSIASLSLSCHEGFSLPVYESIIQSTLPFYGGSLWLSQFLDSKELQMCVSGDLEFDAFRLNRVLSNERNYRRLLRHVTRRSAMIERLSSVRHQYKCLTMSL